MKISLSNVPTLHLQVNPQFLAEELPSGIVFFEGIEGAIGIVDKLVGIAQQLLSAETQNNAFSDKCHLVGKGINSLHNLLQAAVAAIQFHTAAIDGAIKLFLSVG